MTTEIIEIDSPQKLQQPKKSISDLPDVDKQKVEAIKQAIADGSFEIDADAIASKIIQFEQETS